MSSDLDVPAWHKGNSENKNKGCSWLRGSALPPHKDSARLPEHHRRSTLEAKTDRLPGTRLAGLMDQQALGSTETSR